MSPVQTSTYPNAEVRPVTLNDLRLRSEVAGQTSAKSTVGLTGVVLVAALAAGAFVMFDPLGMKHTGEQKPAPLAMAPAAPSVPIMSNQIVAPPVAPAVTSTPALAEPATELPLLKSEPKATLSRAPVTRATVTKQRSTTTTSESRRSDSAADTTASSPAVTTPSVNEPREIAKPATPSPSTGPEAQADPN